MPEEQNFATITKARPNLAGGRGVRRDFQCEFTDFPAGNFFWPIGPLTRGWDPWIDLGRPLMGGRSRLG
jgi:hypothetical protein